MAIFNSYVNEPTKKRRDLMMGISCESFVSSFSFLTFESRNAVWAAQIRGSCGESCRASTRLGWSNFQLGKSEKNHAIAPPKNDLLTCLLMHLNAKRMWTVEIESYLCTSLERWQMAWIFSRPSRFFHMSWPLNYKRRGTSSSHSFWYLLPGAVG